MAELKTKETDADVMAFLQSLSDEGRRQECFELVKLFEQWVDEKPKMWGTTIVGFGNYHYRYASRREGDWFLTGFSPRKQNLTLYISAGFNDYEAILKQLGKYKTGKSCLYVKKLSDIDLSLLKQLVQKAVADMKERYS